MEDSKASNGPVLVERNVTKLASSLHGRLLRPDSEGYDVARQVFNAMINRRPALIIECADADDVVIAVKFAREYGLLVSIRGGGHSISGSAVCDGGMLIDLSFMKDVHIDPERRIVRAQAGLLLGELDQATQAYGLATPLGVISVTGIAGLTLGGGIGWLNGKYGLACDNVLSVDIVTADGEYLTANAEKNAELFWGIRGGSGNFGVVTSFEYQLHPVGEIMLGAVTYDVDDVPEAQRIFRQYDEFAASCPDELTLEALVSRRPDGGTFIEFTGCYCGSLEAGKLAIDPLTKFAEPATFDCQPMNYVDLQCRDDEHFPKGMQHYWKSNFIRSINDDAVEIVMHYNSIRPPMRAPIVFQQMHGAAARVSPTETAFAHRYNQHDFMVLSAWVDPADSARNIEWTRSFWEAVQPFTEKSVYVNNLGTEGSERIKAAYGTNYARLLELKNKYDPTNFFRMNQNIEPSIRQSHATER